MDMSICKNIEMDKLSHQDTGQPWVTVTFHKLCCIDADYTPYICLKNQTIYYVGLLKTWKVSIVFLSFTEVNQIFVSEKLLFVQAKWKKKVRLPFDGLAVSR